MGMLIQLAWFLLVDIKKINYEKLWYHLKSQGLYLILGYGKLESTLEEMVIYRSLTTSEIWIRPRLEFEDGRFIIDNQ